MKRVLILNASHNDERMIKALKDLNFYVISTGNASDLAGHKLCDEYISADYSDKEAILKIAKDLRVDRICACCNDFGVITSAYVTEQLGIPGYDSYETTLILHNKDRFKKFSKEHGISTPEAVQFIDADSALKYVETVEYPIMIKAVDLSAGNGIRRADNFEEAKAAVWYSFETSRIKHIIIEPCVKGSQHGFCTFLINKKVVAYCSNDEYSIVNPYRVEIDTFPASDEDAVQDLLISEIENMAHILNLCDGIFHLQYITDQNGTPHIIECMRRIPGGLYTIPAENVSGINWDYWEVRAKCTDDLSDFPVNMHENKGYFSYKCIMANENGVIEKIEIDKEILKHEYNRWILLKEGDQIDNYLSTPIEYIFTAYDSAEDMQRVMVKRYKKSHVYMKM